MNNSIVFKKNNSGFSILELIVVIAIVATLTGLIVPQFMTYVTKKKADSCRQNREAILSVFEKSVYDMTLDANQTSLNTVLAASDSSILPQDYMNQVKGFLTCPEDDQIGHYSANFYEGVDATTGALVAKAYITCDCHPDDVCMVDLTGWVSTNEEEGNDDGVYTTGSGTKGYPFNPDSTGTDDDDDDPITYDEGEIYANLGVWPYTLRGGKTDIRWQAAGTATGKYVSITVPAYAHFKDNGTEYVIVRPNDSTGKGYKVMYEKSESPAMNLNDGCLYKVESTNELFFNANGSINEKTTARKEPFKNVDISTDENKDVWRVTADAATGDVVTIHFNDGSTCTYIYTGANKSSAEIPTTDQKSYGVNYNDWYVVPNLFE